MSVLERTKDPLSKRVLYLEHQLTWLSPMFMYNDEVSNVVSPAGVDELTHDVIPPVQSLGTRKDQS